MRASFSFLVIAVLFPVFAMGYPKAPDADETPGSVCTESNEDFTEYRYPEQISYCERNVAASLKKKIYDWYGISESERKNYTIDHLVPLSIGGDNDRRNLWPEHKEVKGLRPNLEMQLYLKLKAAKIKQKAAIASVMEAKFNPIMAARRFEVHMRPLNLLEVIGMEIH